MRVTGNDKRSFVLYIVNCKTNKFYCHSIGKHTVK